MRHIPTFTLVFLTCFSSSFGQRCDSVAVKFLEDAYHVDFSGNNRLVIFKNGQEKFDDLFAAVRQARHSIHMEYFNFRNDSISGELFGLLKEKAAEGVEVRALFDGFGNSSNNRPLQQVHLDSLRAHGVEIHEFDPLRFPWVNHAIHRDHRKIVVIDGVVAYTGGMNVADYYINGKPEFGDWRDIHLRVEGDAVADLQGVFINFWNRTTGQNLHGTEYYPGTRDASMLFAGLKPDTTATAGGKLLGTVNRDIHASANIMHDTFVQIIDHAQSKIQIINPYLTLCRHIKKALKRAARRGVKVEIMISAKGDIPIVPEIVLYHSRHLMKAGARIHVYEGGFHHSKIMMVDDSFTFVGSANLNSRSLSFDYECNLLVADAPSTLALQSIFEEDRDSRCHLLTEERWKQIPKRKKFLGWLYHFLMPFT